MAGEYGYKHKYKDWQTKIRYDAEGKTRESAKLIHAIQKYSPASGSDRNHPFAHADRECSIHVINRSHFPITCRLSIASAACAAMGRRKGRIQTGLKTAVKVEAEELVQRKTEVDTESSSSHQIWEELSDFKSKLSATLMIC